MINLSSTSDKIQVVTGTAVTNIDVHTSWVDYSAGTVTPGRTNTRITTAATTDIVTSPAASTYRNVRLITIRNTSVSTSSTVLIQHTDGTTAVPLWYGTLQGGIMVRLNEQGEVQVLTAGGIAYADPGLGGKYYNHSVANQGAGFASDTYVTGSNILIPAQLAKVGTLYTCEISGSKTAAGTATPIINLRVGTAATTADTSRGTYTFSAGTAATDQFRIRIIALFRTVGSGVSAVLQSHCEVVSQPTTGFSSLLKGIWQTSGGFDSTVANSYIGVSVNGGASASWTLYQVLSHLENV